MMDDDFIDSVITPKPQSREEAMNREFYGMMAVQHSDEDKDYLNEGGDE